MFEIFSIKQEPELDIISDNECDLLSGIRPDNEDNDSFEITILNDDNVHQKARNACFPYTKIR